MKYQYQWGKQWFPFFPSYYIPPSLSFCSMSTCVNALCYVFSEQVRVYACVRTCCASKRWKQNGDTRKSNDESEKFTEMHRDIAAEDLNETAIGMKNSDAMATSALCTMYVCLRRYVCSSEISCVWLFYYIHNDFDCWRHCLYILPFYPAICMQHFYVWEYLPCEFIICSMLVSIQLSPSCAPEEDGIEKKRFTFAFPSN